MVKFLKLWLCISVIHYYLVDCLLGIEKLSLFPKLWNRYIIQNVAPWLQIGREARHGEASCHSKNPGPHTWIVKLMLQTDETSRHWWNITILQWGLYNPLSPWLTSFDLSVAVWNRIGLKKRLWGCDDISQNILAARFITPKYFLKSSLRPLPAIPNLQPHCKFLSVSVVRHPNHWLKCSGDRIQ